MKKKINIKRILFVSILSVASVLGMTSFYASKQADKHSVVQQAKATDELCSTIYIKIESGWNNSDGVWADTYIWFYSIDKDNISNLHGNPSTSISGYISDTKLNPNLNGNTIASVSVPDGAKSFSISNLSNSTDQDHTEGQLIQSASSGINMFVVDTNYSGWGTSMGYRQNGYWSFYNKSPITQMYLDRKGSGQYDKTLTIDFLRINNTNSALFTIISTVESIEFSSYCYGGSEFSNLITNATPAKTCKICIRVGSASITKQEDNSDDFIPLSTSNSAMLYTIKNSSWSSKVPQKIDLIADINDTPKWYKDDSSLMFGDSCPVKTTFRDSSNNTLGGNPGATLEPIVIDGVTYGKTQIPFGAVKVQLNCENGKSSHDAKWCYNVLFSDYEFGGRPYIVMKTTTNYKGDYGIGGENWNQNSEVVNDAFIFSISYSGFSGTHEESYPDEYIYGIGVSLDAPTKTGYTFGGYYDNSEYTGSRVTGFSSTDSGDKTIYTKWNPTLHTITWYDDDETTILRTDHNVPYDSIPTYEGAVPHKTGYGFTGWSPSIHAVDGDNSYVAQYAECPAVARIYINYTWGNSEGPYVGSSYGPAYQSKAALDSDGGIDADVSHFIPASADGDETFVGTWSRVADVALPSSGQDSIYLTYFQGDDRWVPYKSGMGQSVSNRNGMENGIMQDKVGGNKVNFNNGYIYTVSNFTGKADGDRTPEYKCNVGYSDSYDGNESRKVKWTEYSISCVGVFVHFNLNGGSFSASHALDEEVALNSEYTLPATPTRSGHTFMGWEASTNGILNRASTTFRVSQPMTFNAVWASNTIEVVGGEGTGGDSKVRVWVSYDNLGVSDVASLMYNGYGCECRLWVHSGNNSDGEYHEVIRPTGTIYNTNENAGQYLTNCPRRFDYYDVPLKYFTNGWYLNVQRYKADGSYDNHQTGQLQLASSDAFAFKIIYVQTIWENVPGAYDITTGQSSALLAAYGLSGIKTCCSNLMNGYGGYNRWYSTFAQSNTSIISGLSNFTFTDYVNLSDYSSEDDILKTVNGTDKYIWVKWMKEGQVLPMPNPGLSRLGGNILISDDTTLSTIIIVIASSISLLSITALSVLVIKKRKQKE